MKPRPRRIATAVLATVLSVIPALAVFKEKDINNTLTVLKFELRNSYEDIQRRSRGSDRRETEQRQVLVNLINNCNELSLMLYSQPQDMTFDLTYALDEVTKQYTHFDANRMPYVEIVESMKIDLQRYDKLAQTLRNLPPAVEGDANASTRREVVLDSLEVYTDTLLSTPSFLTEKGQLDSAGIALRDSCLFYADELVRLFWENIDRIQEDSRYYEETDQHLKEAYDYAQDRYRQVQKKVILGKQRSYSRILKRLPRYIANVKKDCRNKYGTESFKSASVSEWRGPMVVWMMVVVIIYIVFSVVLSSVIIQALIRWRGNLPTDYMRQNKAMLIALVGVIIFSLTIWIVNLSLPRNNFVGMATGKLGEFAWLLAAIFASMLIRLNSEQSKKTLNVYLPLMVTGFAIVTFRVIFAPNSLVNLVFPPILLLVTIWQTVVNIREKDSLAKTDHTFAWITLGVMAVSTVASFIGYVMMALVFMMWWIFQFSFIISINALFFLLSRYYDNHITKRLAEYRRKNPGIPFRSKGAFIEVSWAYDLVKMVIVPVLTIWSVPLCVVMAGNVFDLSHVFSEFFTRGFLNVNGVIHLSPLKLFVVVTLFFVFNYICYLAKALYRIKKTKAYIRKLADGVVFKESDINFNLANNLIALITWGIYVIIVFTMLKIPTSALTIITTGLATGIGFAMKDVLNNFFYGIQLMSGRLRVGDVVECDGIRGTVDNMNYQTTTILAFDGSIIAFSNSNLFAKNFKNLTRNHQYEYLAISVGVAYGTDIDRVRELIINSLKVLQVRDKYGREVVDTKKGVTVKIDKFGDSSIDLLVTQFTTVDSHYTYAAQAKEIIYNTLNANGVVIPFPQRDLYIKELPSSRERD